MNIVTSKNDAVTQSKSAMALFDKYGFLKTKIEESRQKTIEAQRDKESIHQQIEKIEEQRKEMIREIKKVKLECSTLQQNVKESCNAMKKLEHKKIHTEKEKDSVKTSLKLAKHRIEEERLAFLERCNEFRKTCENIRKSTADFDFNSKEVSNQIISHNLHHFFSISSSEEDTEEEEYGLDSLNEDDLIINVGKTGDSFIGLQSNSSTVSSLCGLSAQPDFEEMKESGRLVSPARLCYDQRRANKLRTGTKQRRIKGKNKRTINDMEMTIAKENMTVSKSSRNQAARGLEDTKHDHTEASARAEDRIKKLEQQREQLRRVEKDIINMESKITRLEKRVRDTNNLNDEQICDVHSTDSPKHGVQTVMNVSEPSIARDFEVQYKKNSNNTSVTRSKNSYSVTPSPHHAKDNKKIAGFKDKARPPFSNYSQVAAMSNNNGFLKNPYKRDKGAHIHHRNNGQSNDSQKNSDTNIVQYPHHADRFRTDRQFSTSLALYDSHISSHEKEHMRNLNSLDENSRGDSKENRLGIPDPKCGDEDDEDDDLLSYVTFRKK